MNTRRWAAGGVMVAALVLSGAWVASAAVSQVRMGNFYYEDATVGDGVIEIDVGDQLRFLAEDNGPGTPHTADVDELGIHSGGLAAGETYTTPPINQAGTFRLYCDFHERRGHVTTLVVRGTSATTTTAPATTTTTTRSTTTTSPATTTTTGSEGTTTTGPGATTTVAGPITTTSGSAGGGSTTTAPDPLVDDPTGPSSDSGTDTTLAPDTGSADDAPAGTVPSGRGTASADELAAIPPAEGSLESVLGRSPATRGPWTRSVRFSLLAFIPMVMAAIPAYLRHRNRGVVDEPEG